MVDNLLEAGGVEPQGPGYAAVIGAAANGYAEVVARLLQAMIDKQVRGQAIAVLDTINAIFTAKIRTNMKQPLFAPRPPTRNRNARSVGISKQTATL